MRNANYTTSTMAAKNVSPPMRSWNMNISFDYPTFGVPNTSNMELSEIERIASNFYTYFTPVILIVGLVGNGVSLCVFASKNMREMSASRYLAALSIADICSLVFYVFTEWLYEGLPHIYPGFTPVLLNTNIWCQLVLYLSYVSRFLSVWLVVCFTTERLVGVCMPFRRRTLSGTTKVIATITLISCMLVLYKPILSGVRSLPFTGSAICASREEFEYLSFILDSVYGGLLSIVPFVIITVCNVLIVRVLIHRKQIHRESLITDESSVRLEFTFIMLAISVFFIVFNMPYFVVWLRKTVRMYSNGLQESSEVSTWRSALKIVRTLFFINFCVNFFLYSVTGKYFRRELMALFGCKRTRMRNCRRNCRNNSCSTHYSHVNRNSWV